MEEDSNGKKIGTEEGSVGKKIGKLPSSSSHGHDFGSQGMTGKPSRSAGTSTFSAEFIASAEPKQRTYISTREEFLNAEEKDFYTELQKRMKKKMRISNAACFEEITNLRKAVSHPSLVQRRNGKKFLQAVSHPSLVQRRNGKKFQSSTKIEALKEEILNMLDKDCSAKAIVVSVFSDFLHLIHDELQQSGIKCIQVRGSMRMDERKAVYETFIEEQSIMILLMNINDGGIVSKLTIASYVFLMEPWLNEADEKKLCDIIEGDQQYKATKLIKFVIHGTIEDKILDLQKLRRNEGSGKLNAKHLQFLCKG